ncbi:MAG: hypothetical protein FJ398_02470 [Verrucomicrobia bacterium]|nr:hypothetical protein [Verrucomicrobiota bacterium]
MAEESAAQASFWPGRRWRIGLNVALSIVAVSAILVMVNFIAARRYERFNWGAGTQDPLSPVTLRVLEALTNQVKIIVFFDHREPLFSAVRKVLDQYEVQCSRLDVEYVDYTFSPGRAEEIRTAYDLAEADKDDRIIFACNGKKKVVHAGELSEYDYSGVFTERKVKRTTFRGEQLFTSAICSVIDTRTAKAYFLEGHREHDPTDRRDQIGYMDFAKVLQENNVAIGRLSLLNAEIPADCQLLIVASPLNPIAEEELEKIDKYLSQGGRMLALFNHDSRQVATGLEALLANWGVEVGRDLVTDKPRSSTSDPRLVIVTEFGDHPLVKPLRRSRLALALPRSISLRSPAQRGADSAKVTPLAVTSPEGVVNKGPNQIERRGIIPLIVAVEKGSIQGISADRGETRMVVAGESWFLGNTVIDFDANRDFARLAINWLINRELLLEGIGPRKLKEFTISMTQSEMQAIRWLLVGVLPGSVLSIGILVWARRRS